VVVTRKTKYIILALGTILVAGILINYPWWLNQLSPINPWQPAAGQKLSIHEVTVKPLDHAEDWPADLNSSNVHYNIYGAAGHWLMYVSGSIPDNRPSYVWYDGHLIADGDYFFDNFTLSSDGLHYAYTRESFGDNANPDTHIPQFQPERL
jgi:hypothetical protein